MTGQQLFNKYSKRDFTQSESDVYAQTLMSIFSQIGDEIFPLLEDAESQNKKLDLKVISSDEQFQHDEIQPSDIIFV